ncbi:Hsp70 family protein [Actinoplanes sp. NPDC049599]|uniref:Hsp70 family protein n=1 Tax=Actinoplanes sp. NPDC049599 TaxID=3363903 RepID=UPI0037ACFD75
MHSRLAIDYGAATVRAVLVAPGGTTTLTLDGTGEMSTAAHITDGGIVTGAAAWRQAATDPDGLVVSPLRTGTGQVTAGGQQVEVVDLVAATLRQVAAEAQRVAGEPVEDVRLVVPAGWGPRRRTWMRHAARGAGLAVSRLVEAPVAAIARLDTRTAAAGLPGDGRPALVIDVGAGCEVTVVQRDPAGAEVVSTLADPDAGGDRLDAALVTTLTATELHDMPAGQRWPMLINIRTARHALSEQVAVTMPMPDGQPPMVINAGQVAEVARPVFERAGELAAQALDNADLTLDQVSGVHLIGAAAVTPGAGDMIAAKLGATPVPGQHPHMAAVLGAADATTTEAAAVEEQQLPLPPVRRLITLALPGMASLVLFASYIFFSDDYRLGYHNTTAPLADWGVPAVAATLAMICLLQAAALFAALLDHNTPTTTEQPPGRISGGITIALLGGLATATMYAITAGLYFNQPIPRLAQGIVLTVLPIAVFAAAVAVLAWRRGVTPPGGWDGFLTFPATSMIIAVAGIVAVNLWYTVAWPWYFAGWSDGIGLAGGLLIGVAAACTLVRHPGARLALTVPVGFFTVIISRTGPAPLATIWALAVACWWGVHVWGLLRTPPIRR